jgi:hypothetical protein
VTGYALLRLFVPIQDKAGTVGGTILVVHLQMDIHKITNAALVAAVGWAARVPCPAKRCFRAPKFYRHILKIAVAA